ncbi:MAG: class II aldolase/adducin family protein [Syntrophomonadaceae bacterium]
MKYLELRRQVVKTAQEILAARMVTGTWGNVSLRVPGEELLIITPSGMEYEKLQSEDMVLVDFSRQVKEGSYRPSIETPMHLAIYQNRPDVNAVVHVHSPYATAFAVAGKSIPVILEETAQAVGHIIEVVPYARCGSKLLASQVVDTLGPSGRAVLLAMHGMVGVGIDVKEALKVCYITEKTALVALLARQLGPLPSLEQKDIDAFRQGYQGYLQEPKDS